MRRSAGLARPNGLLLLGDSSQFSERNEASRAGKVSTRIGEHFKDLRPVGRGVHSQYFLVLSRSFSLGSLEFS